jgi:hypothetical protein
MSFLGYPDKLFMKEEKSLTTNNINAVRGLSVLIKAPGKWDLFEYACKRNENCEQSPAMGKRLSTVSGGEEGEEVEHEVIIDYDETWSDYAKVKLFVRPAIDSKMQTFTIEESELPQAEIKLVGEEQDRIEAVLVPVATLNEGFHEMAVTFQGK